MRSRITLILGLLVASAAGCSRGGGEPAAPPARPESRTDTLWLEGMPEPVTSRLYASPAEFPLPFTTYVPPDLIAEARGTGADAEVRFVAAFAGTRRDDAYLSVRVLPAGTPESDARARARDAAAEFGGTQALRERQPDAPPRFPWSLAEHDAAYRRPDGQWSLATVALGRHADRYVLVVLNYPEDFAEGFGPRAHRVLEHWRWEDTGEGLGG